jgi:hypothetical protein
MEARSAEIRDWTPRIPLSLHAGYAPRTRMVGASPIRRILHSAIGANATAGMPLAS